MNRQGFVSGGGLSHAELGARGLLEVGDGACLSPRALFVPADAQGTTRPVHIGPGCQVGAFAVIFGGTVLGEDCRIEEHVLVGKAEHGYAVGHVYPGAGAGTVIGRGAVLRSGAVVYARTEIGDDTVIGHHTLLRSLVTVGTGTQLGHHLTVERASSIGARVRCSPGSHITSSCVLADRVFLGAGVRTVNDRELKWGDPDDVPELVPLLPGISEITDLDARRLGRFEGALLGLLARYPIGPEVEPPHRIRHLRRIRCELARIGYLGWAVPARDGGHGGPALAQTLAQFVCGYHDADLRDSTGLGHGRLIARYAAAPLRERWLPRLLSGALPGIAITEPHGGSQVHATRTAATTRPDGSWTLTGTKTCISRLDEADVFIVFFKDPAGELTAGAIDATTTALGGAAAAHDLVAAHLCARRSAGIIADLRDNALITLGRAHAQINTALLGALTAQRLSETGDQRAVLGVHKCLPPIAEYLCRRGQCSPGKGSLPVPQTACRSRTSSSRPVARSVA